MKTVAIIRPFQAADYEEAAMVWREVLPQSADLSDSREFIEAFLSRNPALSLVAVSGDHVVGAILAGHDGRRGYIYHLGVLPEYRRMGIGAALLGGVEQGLASAGIMKTHLFVLRDNPEVCPFYQRLGYQRREDIVAFSKPLRSAAAPWMITEMLLAEVGPVAAMIERVFDEFIGPGYTATGVQTFKNFIEPAEFARRSLNGNFVLIAKNGAEIVGVLEMKDYQHVSLLFVAKEYHRQGIATHLFHRAVTICRRARPEGFELTVNSSPCAVPVYRRLGFTAVAPEQVRDGIRFVPMILKTQN